MEQESKYCISYVFKIFNTVLGWKILFCKCSSLFLYLTVIFYVPQLSSRHLRESVWTPPAETLTINSQISEAFWSTKSPEATNTI